MHACTGWETLVDIDLAGQLSAGVHRKRVYILARIENVVGGVDTPPDRDVVQCGLGLLHRYTT